MNGRSLKSGSFFYHSNGRSLKSGSFCYHDNGSSMGKCPKRYRLRDRLNGVKALIEIDFETDEVTSVGYEVETDEYVQEYGIYIPDGSVDYISSYCN